VARKKGEPLIKFSSKSAEISNNEGESVLNISEVKLLVALSDEDFKSRSEL